MFILSTVLMPGQLPHLETVIEGEEKPGGPASHDPGGLLSAVLCVFIYWVTVVRSGPQSEL